MEKFRLTSEFLAQYKDRKPPFGFNGLGELVHYRTYSRVKSDGVNEQWWETCARVVEGTYNMQKRHIEHYQLGWNPQKAQFSAQEMYDRMYTMKFLPPGRGLWAMGSVITEERGNHEALNNCAFTSTKGIAQDFALPFMFLMDASMLGVGVGFDTAGAGSVTLQKPGSVADIMVIPDSREGWVDSVGRLLRSYSRGSHAVQFDYSLIRPAGALIKGFGGVASGPAALCQLHTDLRVLLDGGVGLPVSKRLIVDIMNMIGRCVVSGNVRRTAEAAIDSGIDVDFLQLKDYTTNPDRAAYGWASNNSVNVPLGSDYTLPARYTQQNGEPGYLWMDNVRDFSRMNNGPDFKDSRAEGTNPCFEQSLCDKEMCCLVESFPNRCDSLEDYKRTLKFAYLYAKTVTLGSTHWPETNRVLLRNRRIGCSMSGIAQFIATHGLHALREWCEAGYKTLQRYDEVYSEWMCIPRSVKVSSVKPSGSVSLLAGATPGIHYPHSRWYIRRVRVDSNSPLVGALISAGYPVEPCVGQEESTVVVEVPVAIMENVRTLKEVTMWEQLELAAFMQAHWSDNQVSCSVSFDPETEGPHIANALNFYQYRLKGISFLPRTASDVYPQMPYEDITEEEYLRRAALLTPLDFSAIGAVDGAGERFCDSDHCQL